MKIKKEKNKSVKIILFFTLFSFCLGSIYLLFSIKPTHMKKLPKLGSTIPLTQTYKRTYYDIPTKHWSSFMPYKNIKVDKIKFLVFYKQNNHQIWFIKVCDPNFKNTDGISPGQMTINELTKELNVRPNSLFKTLTFSDGWSTDAFLEPSMKANCFIKKYNENE